jgi:single-strand DNA-binding protein
MAKDLNKVQLTGRLGAEPEMRYTPGGTAVTTFRVASGRSWKGNDGEKREDAEWFRVVAWDKLGEICNQYLGKGDRVYIEGRLQTRQWQDQNGQTRYTTEVIAQDMIILESRNRQAPPADLDMDPDGAEEVTAPAPARTKAVNSPSQRNNSSARRSAAAPVTKSKVSFPEEDLPF